MKTCPFCKNEIDSNAAQCPICKMTLIEKTQVARPAPKQTYTPPKPKSSSEQTYTYRTVPKKNFTSANQSKALKAGSSLATLAILGLIIFLTHHSNPLPPPAPISTNTQPVTTLPVPHAPYYSLPNGTVLFSDTSDGLGTLSISNGSGSDAVVKLITNGGSKVYEVYIQVGDNYTIRHISDGVYRLAFEFGSNWDTTQKTFLVDRSAESFDDTFNFETSDLTSSIQYTTFNVTLNPVADGNATTSTLDPSEFDKY
jgi:hypothetical protein